MPAAADREGSAAHGELVNAIIKPGDGSTAGPLALAPLNSVSLRDQAYALLKDAIAGTDIYGEQPRCGSMSGS